MAIYTTLNNGKIMIDDYIAATVDKVYSCKAVEMLNRAKHLNDIKRKYTASARLIAQVEELPGFAWTGETLKLDL
jgi:hypothetical protein